MKLNALLQSVFQKLGVDPNSDEAKAVLGNTHLATIDVADGLSKKLEVDFFTKESALANPDIRSVIKAETLNGIDAQIEEIMKHHIGDEEIIKSIKEEGKTMKRLDAFTKKVKELEGKKAASNDKGKEELTKQIDALNLQKSELVKQHEIKIAEIEQSRKMDKVDWEHEAYLLSLDYSLPDSMSKEAKAEVAKAIISKDMKTKGVRFSPADTGIEILTNGGTKYFENNNQVGHKDYIKKVLLDNKLLKISDGGGSGKGQAGQQGRQQGTQGSGQEKNSELKINTGHLDTLLDESMKRMGQ